MIVLKSPKAGARLAHAALPWLVGAILAMPTIAAAGPAAEPTTPARLANGDVTSSLSTDDGRTYRLTYVAARQRIEISGSGGTTTVFKIRPGHDPELVDATRFIRFLPRELQPYLGQGDALILVAERTNGGDGGGQCGAGIEGYLKVLDLQAKPPRIVASHLVQSCAKDIELDSDGATDNPLLPFTVRQGVLEVDFLSYAGLPVDQTVTGRLSGDLKKLLVAASPNGPAQKAP